MRRVFEHEQNVNLSEAGASEEIEMHTARFHSRLTSSPRVSWGCLINLLPMALRMMSSLWSTEGVATDAFIWKVMRAMDGGEALPME